jgi:hypothetical protein
MKTNHNSKVRAFFAGNPASLDCGQQALLRY